MPNPSEQTSQLPILLFASAALATFKRHGTLIAGLAPCGIKISSGDIIEARWSGKPIFRTAVWEVSYPTGSPPPPTGTDRIGLFVNPDDVGDIQDNLEIWIVARNS